MWVPSQRSAVRSFPHRNGIEARLDLFQLNRIFRPIGSGEPARCTRKRISEIARPTLRDTSGNRPRAHPCRTRAYMACGGGIHHVPVVVVATIDQNALPAQDLATGIACLYPNQQPLQGVSMLLMPAMS